ncbi:MAG: response regulator transcription factor [Candidatus Staskawiczbacteria bacterium]|jgi:DNA-binding response OmpR family regulator
MKILIIEDNESLAKVLKMAFVSNNYPADYVTSGVVGNQRLGLSPKSYNLIILDLMLPEKSGFEIIKDTRQNKIDIPIVVLSARYEEKDYKKAFELGANGYFTKPFSFKELLATVKNLTKKKNGKVFSTN